MTPGVRYGFIGGAVVVFYYTLCYVANPNLLLNNLFLWSGIVCYPIFMWLAAVEDCTANGTSRDFREIVRTPFVTFLLINLCYWLFSYGLHLYDPNLLQAELRIELDWYKNQVFAGLGDPEQANEFREHIQKLEKLLQSPQPQPLGPIVMNMCMGALGGFVLAAGVAALARRRRSGNHA